MTTYIRRTGDKADFVPSSPSDDGGYNEVACEWCGSGGHEDELLLCDKCDRGYHVFCLKPILPCVPNGSWFCSSCISQKKLKRMCHCRYWLLIYSIFFIEIRCSLSYHFCLAFPLVQTKLVDFFQIQKCSSPSPIKSHSGMLESMWALLNLRIILFFFLFVS